MEILLLNSTPTQKKKLGLTAKILLSMALGLVVGMVLFYAPTGGFKEFFIDGVFYVGGKVFVASLKMLVVPLVVVSLVCGTATLGDPKKLGRVGFKTVGLYLLTTAIAITMALMLAVLFQPGTGFEMTSEAVFQAKEPPGLRDIIVNIVPSNPLDAMAKGNMLQVIFFSILFGIALALVKSEYASKLSNVFNAVNDVIMKMIMILMEFAPYGVFCLIATVFATQGLTVIIDLLAYFLLVAGVLFLHWAVVYPTLLKVLSGLNPVTFMKKIRTVLTFAFSTSSSNATIPITLETVEHDLGVDNSVASFTVPLGATINMDGTAIMQGVATVFIANAYQVDLSMMDYLMVVLTATLASVGTAGVPGVGLIMLAMVLKQVNLPVEGIGLILGVDRLLDMMRTAVNVTGDMAVTCIVAKSEKSLDTKVFNNPQGKLLS